MVDQALVEQEASRLLEREVQVHLSKNLHLLGIPGLKCQQLEYQTPVGRIDIFAADQQMHLYAIEVKRGKAVEQDIGQVLKYLGALDEKFPLSQVHGVLVARELTSMAEAAIRGALPRVHFFQFAVHFDYHNRTPVRRVPPVPPSPPIDRSNWRHCKNCRALVDTNVINSMAALCKQCGNLV